MTWLLYFLGFHMRKFLNTLGYGSYMAIIACKAHTHT